MKNLVQSVPRTVLWLCLFVAVSVIAKTFTFVTGLPAQLAFSAPSGATRIEGKEPRDPSQGLGSLLTSQTTAPCSLTFNRVDVSGCYSVSGVSKATVSVEVAWTDAPTNGYIVVTAGVQSRTITPGTITVDYGYQVGNATQLIVSPQVVAFEIPADGASGTITAVFSDSPDCTVTQTYIAPAACPPTDCATGNQLGGTVFNDYNADGTKNAGETTGISSVSVTAIACDGTKYTTTTDNFGQYALTIPQTNYPVRVEFSNLPAYAGMGTLHGTDGQTTVQFVKSPTCGVDLGVLDPTDYCQANPQLFVPCYVNGDPLVSGTTSSDADAFVSFPYSATGAPKLTGYVGPTHIATAGQVGSLWGVAYNKYTKRVFSAAVLRRHVGLGPLGIGGIYVADVTNPASATMTSFIDVRTLGIVVEDPASPVLSNTARGLSASKTSPSFDTDAFSKIGTVGLGDIEISDDGNKLWFVNLYDKKLYSIDISAYNADGTTLPTAANVTSVPITNPACANGTYRPFGLKVLKGTVYVGAVCDAGVSQDKADLRAFVFAYNGVSWSTIFDFPLTYPKGFADPNSGLATRTGWYPWTNDFAKMTTVVRDINGVKGFTYPMPILSDIEFDIDGSLVLGFADRASLMAGSANYSPLGNTSPLYSVTSGGDILRAYSSNNAFILENAAKAGPEIGSSPTNNQGPGFGEFYNENLIAEGGLQHAETALGGLALRPGSGEVVSTSIDPVDNVPDYGSYDMGGVIKFNNTTGLKASTYGVYQGGIGTGLLGKAAGLGDIEIACDVPTYLEIGNRVWRDDNTDGVQDACEPPLAGVTVSLYQNGTLVATTSTNADGEYYFNNSPISSTLAGTVSNTAIQPNIAYQIVFGKTQFDGNQLALSGNSYVLTKANSSTTNANDMNDSDALVTTVDGSAAPVISLTTGASGTVNHTYDAGFYQLAGLGDFVFEDANHNGQQDAGEPGIQNVTVTLLSSGTVVATTTTNASGFYSFKGLTPSVPYSVSFTAPVGYSATLQNIGNDTTDSDGNPTTGLTGVYSLTAGEFNPTVDMGYYKLSPTVSLDKFVDKSKAKIGDVLTYTIVVANSGSVSATNVVVRDSSSIGLTYVTNSATAPVGTTFTPGAVNTWTVGTLSAGQSLSLTFQAVADSSGILYNVATIPGDTASVCTSVPFVMCAGQAYTFRLTAALGRSSYKWYKDNVEIAGQTTNILDVSAPGTYSLAVDNVTGKCPDFSCCPFIVEEDTLPTFQATTVPVGCSGIVAQSNGKIVLSAFKPTYTYQYSLGTSFNEAAVLSGTKQVIPANGVIVSNLANPVSAQAYTVRVYNASGCYTDVTVLLPSTVCDCPPASCVPLLVKQTKRAKRIGDHP
ncbi:SdrD B-like domain-containing protein [Spirosoma litoris]